MTPLPVCRQCGKKSDNPICMRCERGRDQAMRDAAPELYEALKEAREAVLSLDEDALGSFVDQHTGEPIYPLRAELLDKIETALAKARGAQ